MTKEDLNNRLTRCCAVLDIIHEAANDSPLADAIAGASDLLRSICKDLEAEPLRDGWWRTLVENCKGRLPPMYRPFLGMCSGTLEGDLLTVYAPDRLTLGRVDTKRVREALIDEVKTAFGKSIKLEFRSA